MVTVTTPIVEQLQQRPGTITTYPAAANTPEIKFLDTDVETSSVFYREDGNQVGFALTHYDHLRDNELHLAVLDPADENYDVVEEVHLSYAEARLLRALLNRDEIARWLDQQ